MNTKLSLPYLIKFASILVGEQNVYASLAPVLEKLIKDAQEMEEKKIISERGWLSHQAEEPLT